MGWAGKNNGPYMLHVSKFMHVGKAWKQEEGKGVGRCGRKGIRRSLFKNGKCPKMSNKMSHSTPVWNQIISNENAYESSFSICPTACTKWYDAYRKVFS